MADDNLLAAAQPPEAEATDNTEAIEAVEAEESTVSEPAEESNAAEPEEQEAKETGAPEEYADFDIPEGFTRASDVPVLLARSGFNVGRPAVAFRPEQRDLLMVYEEASRLAVATSNDGINWTPHDQILDNNFPSGYGALGQGWVPPHVE